MPWETRSLDICIKSLTSTHNFGICSIPYAVTVLYVQRFIKLPIVSTLQRVKSNIWFVNVWTVRLQASPSLALTTTFQSFMAFLGRSCTAQTEQAASYSPGVFEDKNMGQIRCCLLSSTPEETEQRFCVLSRVHVQSTWLSVWLENKRSWWEKVLLVFYSVYTIFTIYVGEIFIFLIIISYQKHNNIT